MPRLLIRYEDYSREEVHDIFAPNTPFTPSAGTWGLQGIIAIPNRPGSYIFFVTFGQRQADHEFEEWINQDGILSWQSQPRQSLNHSVIQKFIHHNETKNNIHLFLRTKKRNPYTYLGTLKYSSHNPQKENPVYFLWKIMNWDISESTLERIGLRLLDNKSTEPIIRSFNSHPSIEDSLGGFKYFTETVNFTWRGTDYFVNKLEFLKRIRKEIDRTLPPEATRFAEWYIDIDDISVSPKWVFHLITGAGYDEFDSPTAREKLKKIGFVSIHTKKQHHGHATIANPDRRNEFYRSIASVLPNKLKEDFTHGEIKVLSSKGQLEIHYPEFPLRAYYVVRRRKSQDQIAFWYVQSRNLIQQFVDQLSIHQQSISDVIGIPVQIDHHFDGMGLGRLAIVIPEVHRKFPDRPDILVNPDETEWYAGVLASLIEASFEIIKKIIHIPSKETTQESIQIKDRPEEKIYTTKANRNIPQGRIQRGKKINNATRYAISLLLNDLWQVGEISNSSLSSHYGLKDYHYNLLMQSGLVSWNPDAMTITPKFMELLAKKYSDGENLGLMNELGLNNVRYWDEFHNKTYYREFDPNYLKLDGTFLVKSKTENIWEDQVIRPCILVDYFRITETDFENWTPGCMLELNSVYTEPKQFLNSTLSIKDTSNIDASIKAAFWNNPFYWTALQFLLLSDPETGSIYEHKISLVLMDGFEDNGKINIYLDDEYVCEYREIFEEVFKNYRWIWINPSSNLMNVFKLLFKVDILEKEKDGRAIISEDFREQLFLHSMNHSKYYRQSKPARNWIRERIKQHCG